MMDWRFGIKEEGRAALFFIGLGLIAKALCLTEQTSFCFSPFSEAS